MLRTIIVVVFYGTIGTACLTHNFMYITTSCIKINVI